MRLCVVENCFNKHRRNGYCNKHSTQINKYGKIIKQTIFDKNIFIIYKTHALIEITNRKHEIIAYCIIDLEDVEKCKKYKWCLNHGYVCNRKIGFLHNYILNRKPSKDNIVCDHKDKNKLNNRKYNLRIVSQSINCFNTNLYKNNISGIKGVHFHKKRKYWDSYITFNKKRINLGQYKDKNKAISVRKEAELKYYGKYL